MIRFSIPSPTSPPIAPRQGARDRCRDCRRKQRRPARRRALCGEEPVRREGAADPRRIEDQPRSAPSSRDATLIERMEAAGAVLVGALNMGEYAYDFTGENVHDGPSRNPHDPTRMTGGSSGGSGSAVGGALVPIALGSDTNGSIRVPSSFCGIFRLEADLWPAVARALVSVCREPRSSRPVRAHRLRSRARL